MNKLALLLATAAAFGAIPARADVRLPKILTDHMVLQRGVPIHLWGWAAPGERVSVAFDSTRAETAADALGRWSVYLPAHAAGGPFTLAFEGKNKVELKDVLVGDLWIASGQSNMEMPLAGFPNSAEVKDSEKEIAAANYPQIRLMIVRKARSSYALDDARSADSWKVCAPDVARSFSAVGYFFGRNIHLEEKVPIGLIDTTWGGTPAEAWTSLEGLAQSAALPAVIAARAHSMNQETGIVLQRDLDKQAAAEGKTPPKRSGDQVDAWEPAGLYNAMIAPLTGLSIRGVIWYQGESNTDPDRAGAYEEVFKTMIEDWRAHWGIGDFPFLYVQLAGFQAGQGWAVVREAQRRTLALKNTGMAVAVDVGDPKNVHPARKQEVGERLSLLARSIAYGKDGVANGPLFRQATPIDGAVRVFFDSASGLHAMGGAPGEFEVAGADGVFAPAEAAIEGESVTAHAAKVPHPVFVRYAWTGFPKAANLYNGANLPASPFSSQWPVPAPVAK